MKYIDLDIDGKKLILSYGWIKRDTSMYAPYIVRSTYDYIFTHPDHPTWEFRLQNLWSENYSYITVFYQAGMSKTYTLCTEDGYTTTEEKLARLEEVLDMLVEGDYQWENLPNDIGVEDDLYIPDCPECGSTTFSVKGREEYYLTFRFYRDANGNPAYENVDREGGECRVFERVYCAECGAYVGTRDDIGDEGWKEIPYR